MWCGSRDVRDGRLVRGSWGGSKRQDWIYGLRGEGSPAHRFALLRGTKERRKKEGFSEGRPLRLPPQGLRPY
jgi:hypothetical protein